MIRTVLNTTKNTNIYNYKGLDWMENDYIKYIIDFCRKTFEELES